MEEIKKQKIQLVYQKIKSDRSTMKPSSRQGHSMVYLEKEKSILVFGGMSVERENEVFILDLQGKKWRKQKTEGRHPSVRCFNSYFYEYPYLGIFGGEGEKRLSSNDMYFLNTNDFIWKRLFMKNNPCSRQHASLCESNKTKEVIIFGGVSMPQNTLHNDTWLFNYS